jgi:hypothetical protein
MRIHWNAPDFSAQAAGSVGPLLAAAPLSFPIRGASAWKRPGTMCAGTTLIQITFSMGVAAAGAVTRVVVEKLIKTLFP